MESGKLENIEQVENSTKSENKVNWFNFSPH